MKRLRFIVTILFLIVGSNTIFGQAPESDARRRNVQDKDKVWQPSGSPEQKAAKKSKNHKAVDPNRPLTKKELGKKLKDDEKFQKSEYEKFHNKMQSPKVRKRMRENAKKSTDNNEGKRPSLWRRISIWFHKRK